jgi:hypothetical protein
MLRRVEKSGWEAFRDRANIYEKTLLPGENLEDFEDLLKRHYEEWTPDGTTEEYHTREIAKLRWERDRFERSQQLSMFRRQSDFMTINQFLRGIRKLRRLAPEFQAAKSAEDVEKVLSKVDEPVATFVRGKWPLESSGQSENWGSVIAEGLATLPDLIGNPAKQMLLLQEEFPALEQLHKLEQFDAKIDRTITRLMRVKTMKQMHRQLEPKVISIPQDKRIANRQL